MSSLVRFVLLIALLAACTALIAAHGVRGIALLIVVALAATLPRTRPWRAVERVLVRLTGSRRRAAACIMIAVIAVLAAINLYEYIR